MMKEDSSLWEDSSMDFLLGLPPELDPDVKIPLFTVEGGGRERHDRLSLYPEWLLVDSGSGLHACPRSFGEDFPMESAEPESARTATGAPVAHFGARTVSFLFPGGIRGRTRFNVMGVAKPVLSVSELNRTGHAVTFAPDYARLLVRVGL